MNGTPWTPAEEHVLRTASPQMSYVALAPTIGRSVKATREHARMLGLQRRAITLGQEPTTAFGVLLRRYRLLSGLSQNALAQLVGVNASYINRMERGERDAPTREVAHALARGLGLSVEETDQLLFTAGHVPPTLQKLGPADSTVTALVGALTCDHIPPEDRANLRAMVEVLCAQWQRIVPAVASTHATRPIEGPQRATDAQTPQTWERRGVHGH